MEMVHALIGPDGGGGSVVQVCCRTALLLLFGLLCIRVAGRRTFAQYAPLDIIVAIVIGSNISRMMTGTARFSTGIAATLLIVLLHRALALLGQRWPWLGRLIRGRPITLIRDGHVDGEALRRHELGPDDLGEALRLEQAESPADVALATLEAGGRISVIRKPRR
jgi:uncharacterized membrane protein YcaP (DUF421 family)